VKITHLSAQVRNPDRVNVSIDGKYRFSLDISQITDLGVKVGRELEEAELAELETEGLFGKLYARALEYSLMRPHSVREVRDYLYRKTLTTKYKTKKGEIKERQGYSPTLTTRVLQKLQQKNYVNDEKFARWWIETRHQNQGSSLRKLRSELAAKGVSSNIIEGVISQTDRTDDDEITKMIAKKRQKYTDEHKLMQYLVRQGFSYQQVRDALDKN
jgi:regulatory protein